MAGDKISTLLSNLTLHVSPSLHPRSVAVYIIEPITISIIICLYIFYKARLQLPH